MAKRPETTPPRELLRRQHAGPCAFADQRADQAESFDWQATDISNRSMLIAATLSNAYDFAHKLVSVQEPQQLATLQTEFVRRQAEIFADQMKDVSENMMQEATDVAATMQRSKRRSE